MSEDLQNTEWSNLRDRFTPPPKREPAIDKVVSDIVGKPIKTTDPRLIKLIVKWKQTANKADNSNVVDNYFDDKEKIKELKEVLC